MKCTFLFYLLLNLFLVTDMYAQDAIPAMEVPLYLEDAYGNKDTLIVGYDPDVPANKWALKPQFGEVAMTEPFDSVFEMRLYKSYHTGYLGNDYYVHPETSPYLKKAIGNSYQEDECGATGTLWLTGNVKGGYLIIRSPVIPYSSTNCINYGAWFLNNGVYFSAVVPTLDNHFDCLAWGETIVIDYDYINEVPDSSGWSEDTGEYWGLRRIIEIEGGTTDTVQAFQLGLVRWPGIMPEWDCKFPVPETIDTVDVVGLAEIKRDEISIAPNPFGNNLNIQFNQTGSFEIELSDIFGNIVKTAQVEIVSIDGNYTLNVPNFTKGLYLIRILNSKGVPVFSDKVIKH